MKKFNKAFKTNKTKVKLFNDSDFYLIDEIHETRKWIKIKGFTGSFQRGHVESYTNTEK